MMKCFRTYKQTFPMYKKKYLHPLINKIIHLNEFLFLLQENKTYLKGKIIRLKRVYLFSHPNLKCISANNMLIYIYSFSIRGII